MPTGQIHHRKSHPHTHTHTHIRMHASTYRTFLLDARVCNHFITHANSMHIHETYTHTQVCISAIAIMKPFAQFTAINHGCLGYAGDHHIPLMAPVTSALRDLKGYTEQLTCDPCNPCTCTYKTLRTTHPPTQLEQSCEGGIRGISHLV